MRVYGWFEQARNKIDREEFGHLGVQKGLIQLQLKNPITHELHIEEFRYTGKDAPNLQISQQSLPLFFLGLYTLDRFVWSTDAAKKRKIVRKRKKKHRKRKTQSQENITRTNNDQENKMKEKTRKIKLAITRREILRNLLRIHFSEKTKEYKNFVKIVDELDILRKEILELRKKTP